MVRRAISVGLFVVACAVACDPPSAAAQAGATEARAAFDEGRELARAERWVDALAAFERSRALVDRPSTTFNIAAVLVRLGRSIEALAALDAYLAISDATRDAAMRRDAERLRETAAASLQHVALSVSPANARVEVDGGLASGEGDARMLTLDPGPHSVAVTLDGHAPERFTLAAGESARRVVLRPLDGVVVVRADVASASITLDAAPVGVGHAEAVVPPGPHRVAVTAEGYVPLARDVDVAPGARVAVEVALDAVPAEAPMTESPLFWGLTGGGVALVAGVAIAASLLLGPVEAPSGGSTGVVLAPLVAFGP